MRTPETEKACLGFQVLKAAKLAIRCVIMSYSPFRTFLCKGILRIWASLMKPVFHRNHDFGQSELIIPVRGIRDKAWCLCVFRFSPPRTATGVLSLQLAFLGGDENSTGDCHGNGADVNETSCPSDHDSAKPHRFCSPVRRVRKTMQARKVTTNRVSIRSRVSPPRRIVACMSADKDTTDKVRSIIAEQLGSDLEEVL